MHITETMRAARESLTRRFHDGFASGKECLTILDVVRFLLSEDPIPALAKLDNVRTVQSHWVKPRSANAFHPYGRVHWFQSTVSRMKFRVESERQNGFVAPFTLTVYADDRTGLLPVELFPLLEVAPTAKLTMAELAFDFSPSSDVTRSFALRQGVFGKSARDLNTQNQFGDWWGSRNGSKRAKSYWKDEVCGHRVEFRMRSQFLKHHGINTVYDVGRLEGILPRRHIFFAELDGERLVKWLEKGGLAESAIRDILRNVIKLNADLTATLRYLRRDVGLKNVRRLLMPLPENRLALNALQEWAAKWPTAPTQLGKQK
jgi:hypothetical protein